MPTILHLKTLFVTHLASRGCSKLWKVLLGNAKMFSRLRGSSEGKRWLKNTKSRHKWRVKFTQTWLYRYAAFFCNILSFHLKLYSYNSDSEHLNTELLQVQYSNGKKKNLWPFSLENCTNKVRYSNGIKYLNTANQTCIRHSNTGHLWYSDPN